MIFSILILLVINIVKRRKCEGKILLISTIILFDNTNSGVVKVTSGLLYGPKSLFDNTHI